MKTPAIYDEVSDTFENIQDCVCVLHLNYQTIRCRGKMTVFLKKRSSVQRLNR